MSLFGGLRVRIDPWDVNYGTELPLELSEEAVAEEVRLDVELHPDDWTALPPRSGTRPGKLIFIDGVRRIEVRLIIRDGDAICYGAFGSFAVGSVSVKEGTATFGELRTSHVAAIGSGRSLIAPIVVSDGLTYDPFASDSAEPDAPLRVIQDRMRKAEEDLGRELADEDDALVVADGPLTFETAVRGGAVGYIKRLFKLYLPDRMLPLLSSLPVGHRSPLFALRSSRRFARYAWFLRLATPRAGDSELCGITRLEVSELIGSERARSLADATAAMLPRFVPGRGRDPRSPQNLLPIGALEAQLRRRLGDPRLIRRRIEALIAREDRHV